MADSPRSPKRRRILSSINRPERDADSDSNEYGPRPAGQPSKRHHGVPRLKSTPPRQKEPRDDNFGRSEKHDDPEPQHHQDQHPDADEHSTKPKPTKFRFKSKSSRCRRDCNKERDRKNDGDKDRRMDRDKDRNRGHDSSRSRRRRYRSRSPPHRHHRSSRRHRSPTPPIHDPFAPDPLDPETAFRESLFDAMADDEGAAYWEAIYGQPIHIYSNPEHVNPQTGHLEKMTDEEYAEYVRQKMWEKTHAGLLEAQEKRRKLKKEDAKNEEERRRIAKEMERSFLRGEERRLKRSWRTKFERYTRQWEEWAKNAAPDAAKVPWPAAEKDQEGNFKPQEVRAFFVNGLGLEEIGEKEFVSRLKEERVRWHPDKIQQKLGGLGTVDPKVMKDVTAVFQVVDGLWGEMRKNMGK